MPTPSQYLAFASVAARVTAEVAPIVETCSQRMFKEALGEVFRKAPKLADALPELADAFKLRDDVDASLHLPEFARDIKPDSVIGRTRITRFLGAGGGDFVVATENNTALKIGDEALLRPTPHLAFDAPVLSHGRIGDTFFYTQPIGNTEKVTDEHVVDVIKNIRSSGFVEEDIWGFLRGTRREQVALFGKEERPCLIDQGCATPRYGTYFQNGRLQPQLQQRENLVAVRSYLRENKISLIGQDVKNPVNPTNIDHKSLSTDVTDMQLSDGLIAHMKALGKRPTLKGSWTAGEVDLAVTSLSLK